MNPYHIVIPARYASARLPGKPLRDVCGKPLIVRVIECARASAARSVTVATDDEAIRDAVRSVGVDVCMTAPDLPSGTDRVAVAAEQLGLAAGDIVVNLQGDEPRTPAAVLDQVAECLDRHLDASLATVATPIVHRHDFHNPVIVKVVTDAEGYALYFSRAPIPWPRDDHSPGPAPAPSRRHVGIYAYRVSFLSRYRELPRCELEEIERLEQLRALHGGHRIAVCDACEEPGPGVDTINDLEDTIHYFQTLVSRT